MSAVDLTHLCCGGPLFQAAETWTRALHRCDTCAARGPGLPSTSRPRVHAEVHERITAFCKKLPELNEFPGWVDGWGCCLRRDSTTSEVGLFTLALEHEHCLKPTHYKKIVSLVVKGVPFSP